MKPKQLPPLEILDQKFIYIPEVGKLKYRKKPSGTSSEFAGTITSNGYTAVLVLGEAYKAHRVAWALYYRELPGIHLVIDHINGSKSDNRIENLRLVTQSDNMMNGQLRSDNTSGFRGVCWCKARKRWHVIVSINRRRITIGRYINLEDAITARLNFERENNILVREG